LSGRAKIYLGVDKPYDHDYIKHMTGIPAIIVGACLIIDGILLVIFLAAMFGILIGGSKVD